MGILDTPSYIADIGEGLETLRPLLSAVKHGDQFQPVFFDPVRNNVRRAGNNEFPGSDHTARPADVRMTGKQIHAFQYASGNPLRGLWMVPGDVTSDLRQVLNGATRPNNLHRGALPSPGLPQERSHVETLS